MSKPKKQSLALFVDLSNFYSGLLKSDLSTSTKIRKYFLEWFDFSIFARSLTVNECNVWVFHSKNKLGPSDGRIKDSELKRLIQRMNLQVGVSAIDVNIASEQREPSISVCERCGTENESISKSEKGIDSSLIVHLFDTMDTWDEAFLVSGDADFVPAVRSLRRRGKIVRGVGFLSRTAPALITECYEYIDVLDFFQRDFALYSLFTEDQVLRRLFDELLLDQPLRLANGAINESKFPVTVEIGWQPAYNQTLVRLSGSIVDYSKIRSLASNYRLDHNFGNEFYEISLKSYGFKVLYERIRTIVRDLNLNERKLADGLEEQHRKFTCGFQWNEETQKYERYFDNAAA